MSYLPVAPLMHAAAQWTIALVAASPAARPRSCPARSTPRRSGRPSQDEKVQLDHRRRRRGRPSRCMDAWDAEPGPLGRLVAVRDRPTAARRCRPALKARIAATFPDKMMIDGFGSSETGVQGSAAARAGRRRPAAPAGPLHRRTPTRACSTRTCTPVEPGSGVIGRRGPHRPHPARLPQRPGEDGGDLRRGRRPALRASPATWPRSRPTASIQLLGRGSQCINTGGEKVFPEEVEAVLHDHPAVADVLVVGVPDERWGSAVTAVVSPATGDAARPRRAARALPGHAGRLQAARSTSSSSTGSGAHRPARPTTAGPSEVAKTEIGAAGAHSARQRADRWRRG